MILERYGKRRNLKAANLVQLQKQSTEVVGSLKILEIIIIIVKAKQMIGGPQQPQVIEDLRSLVQMVIMRQVLILPKSLERLILTIPRPMGQPDFISIGIQSIQHQGLATTVMVAWEEIIIGGRELFYKGPECGHYLMHSWPYTGLFGALQQHRKRCSC